MDETVQIEIIRGLIFISVFLLIMGIKFLLKNRNTAEYPEKVPWLYRRFTSEILFCKKICGGFYQSFFPEKYNEVEQYITKADLPLEVSDVEGAQLFWMLVLAMAAGCLFFSVDLDLAWLVVGMVIAGVTGWLMPLVTVQNEADDRMKAIRKEIPFSIDLITAAMASGLDFTAAVRYFVENVPVSPLSHEYAVMLKYLELGHSKNDALKAMADRIDLSEFSSMVSTVVQGTEMGASIVETMKINAEEMRRVRMESAEQTAQRAPSLMMLPMLLFIMPSVFVIIFVPVYLKVQQSGLNQMFR